MGSLIGYGHVGELSEQRYIVLMMKTRWITLAMHLVKQNHMNKDDEQKWKISNIILLVTH